MSELRRIYLLLPLIGFLGLALIFLARIQTSVDPSVIPSALLDKPSPEFSLPALAEGAANVRSADLAGKVTVSNFWASWCLPCRKEHPFLMELAKDDRLQIIGLNYKDEPEKAAKFLRELGDPYRAVGRDDQGRTGIDFGVYGIPETFVIGADGRIKFKWIGPIDAGVMNQYLRPAIDKALAG